MNNNGLICFLLKKIVIQTVMRTYLHVAIGRAPDVALENQCIYFLRVTPGMVPLPNTIDEAHRTLSKEFEIGMLNGQALKMLEQVITQVDNKISK